MEVLILDTLQVEMEYCFGIKKLTHTFDFSRKNGCVIYAPNGTMKTSFAKSFEEFSKNKLPKDLVHTHRKTSFIVKKSDSSDFPSDNVFVIHSYNDEFKPENQSTLLVNKELRKQYDKIYKEINEKKKEIFKILSQKSGLKKGVEEEIYSTFNNENLYDIFISINLNETNNELQKYLKFPPYKEIFDEKAISDLKKSVDISLLNNYIKRYNQLLETSKYLKKGVFSHYNADEIGSSLEKNGFFKAYHTVNLYDEEKKEKIEIKQKQDLDELINQEKEQILNDKDLKDIFEKIDKAIKANKNTRNLRDLLEKHPDVAAELNNINSFKKNIWTSYFIAEKDNIKRLIELYDNGKNDIISIINSAKTEKTEWQKVLSTFKRRFSVPFELKVSNQTDVILKDDAPVIEFIYKDFNNTSEVNVKKDLLQSCLSQGEKRALYLLNIIFEIESLKREKENVLLIIDDIADSFDYKNKYAIIEYLKDIQESKNFKMIILTHNFDFYRTVANRLGFKYKDSFLATKDSDCITLKKGGYLSNIFYQWKREVHKNNRILIASIPFIRNIIEYTEGESSDNFYNLTCLLHIKGSQTESFLVEDLNKIYKEVWNIENDLENNDEIIFNLIFKEANNILNETCESINLENKIVLSIATRLLAEKYIIENVNSDLIINQINSNQTYKLIDLFKNKFPDKEYEIEILENVNLMTPENIHLNSFMYEPLLDMSDDYLKKIYQDVKNLNKNESIS